MHFRVALVALAVLAACSNDSEHRAELIAYEKALAPVARDGGFVVEEGLKVGLRQVASDQPGNVMFQAVSWIETLKKVRERFAEAGKGLEQQTLVEAAKAFDDALTLYERTAETIGAAAIAGGEPRDKLLETAAESGKRADTRYDEALALIQKARKSLGLPRTDGLPPPA